MNILHDDAILKLADYTRDVQEELRIVKIKLEKLKVSEERIEELRLQYLNGSRQRKKEVN